MGFINQINGMQLLNLESLKANAFQQHVQENKKIVEEKVGKNEAKNTVIKDEAVISNKAMEALLDEQQNGKMTCINPPEPGTVTVEQYKANLDLKDLKGNGTATCIIPPAPGTDEQHMVNVDELKLDLAQEKNKWDRESANTGGVKSASVSNKLAYLKARRAYC